MCGFMFVPLDFVISFIFLGKSICVTLLFSRILLITLVRMYIVSKEELIKIALYHL